MADLSRDVSPVGNALNMQPDLPVIPDPMNDLDESHLTEVATQLLATEFVGRETNSKFYF